MIKENYNILHDQLERFIRLKRQHKLASTYTKVWCDGRRTVSIDEVLQKFSKRMRMYPSTSLKTHETNSWLQFGEDRRRR